MKNIFRNFSIIVIVTLISFSCTSQNPNQYGSISETNLVIKESKELGTISVYRADGKLPILTQNAKAGHRPYIHPIIAPDGKGPITEYSPGHHKHQTGLYWGLTRINGNNDLIPDDSLTSWFYGREFRYYKKPDGSWGKAPRPIEKQELIAKAMGRDYFHNYGPDYWQLDSAVVVDSIGEKVSWQTVYNMLDENGETIMVETQKWSMRLIEGEYILDLEWRGSAITDITINEFDYGGMFLRMPWKEGVRAEVINASRHRDSQAEGKKSMWLDIGMQVEGRDDLAHIAIFDHPLNTDAPTSWRVDGQFGVGPARSIDGDWSIEKGTTESINYQLRVFTGELNDLELTNQWVEWGGNPYPYATQLWRQAQEEGRKEKFLEPNEAVDAMTTIEGFKVNAWASEPMITQPMAFCWDDRGRMWIAENRDYESRGDGFSNSGDSKILILEDSDNDGQADNMKVFAEGIAFPAAIAVGFDGVYVGAPPNLLFIPDKDGDDKGDMEDIEILLTGWGIRDRHETINSLHWGPDGWLYGCEGFATPSVVRKPNGKGKLYGHKDPFPEDLLEADGVDINGGVFRYHPTKKIFEVVAHGFSNPWGIDYDSKGQLFISACVIPHLFHVIPGGIYHRQGGQHFNPYVYGDIRTIVDHRHRSAHGGARVYQSDAFPEEHHGRIFMANIHEHAILSDNLEKKGSGFVASHADDFMYANNAQFVGFSMEVGPEGGLYVLDWHDGSICGNEVMHKETGRVFRMLPEQSLAENWKGRYSDLNKMTDLELAELQLSKSDWHSRRARIILQARASKRQIDQDALKKLQDIFNRNSNADYRLRGMWSLHITGGFTEDDLIKSLKDRDEYVRAWAVQMIAEDKNPSDKALNKFLSMAKKDRSAVVRMYIAAAFQRIDEEKRWPIAEALMGNEKDNDDHNIPKFIWFAFEPLVTSDPVRAIEFAKKSKINLVSEYIARRLVDADELDVLASGIQSRSSGRLSMMKGMLDGMEGLSDLEPPKNWDKVYASLKEDDGVAKMATEIAQQFGDIEATMQLISILNNEDESIKAKNSAIRSLANKQHPILIDLIPELIEVKGLRKEAIRAMAAYHTTWDSGNLGGLMMEKYNDFDSSEKLEVVQAMASRQIYARFLSWGLQKGSLSKKDIPAYTARQLRRVLGSGFLEVWGPLQKETSENMASMEKYKTLLTSEKISTANPGKGRYIYDGLCGACHVMYGEGGILGPELTGADRTNIDYLLNNVMDPSGIIQDDYKMVMITTRDGRTYAGNIANENDRSITLRVVGQDAVVISKSSIQSMDNSELSMMPEAMLDDMSTTQILDLFSYLMSQRQVEPIVH
tara:strand:- start:190 stop:4179 length:3990 start_codon:yes stop_codon:yes gene_type:complete